MIGDMRSFVKFNESLLRLVIGLLLFAFIESFPTHSEGVWLYYAGLIVVGGLEVSYKLATMSVVGKEHVVVCYLFLLQHIKCLSILWSLTFESIFDLLNSCQEIHAILVMNSISDSIQYVVGKRWGSTKVFKVTSKTVEGYVAGLVFTPLIAFTLLEVPFNVYETVFLVFLGMVGGLLNSKIKRICGLKDWSRMLGPHGGLNDRLDSWLLPTCWYLSYMGKTMFKMNE